MKLASNSAVYGIAGILNRFTSVILLPFFTQALTTSDYGILSLISLLTVAAIGVFNLGTANSIGLLYFSNTELRYRSQVIWTGVILLSLNCLIFLSLLWYLSPLLSKTILGTDNQAYFIQLALLGMCCSVIVDPLLAYLRMNNKTIDYVLLALLSFFITSGLSVWFVLFLENGVIGILQAQFCGQFFLLILALIYVGKGLKFNIDYRLIWPLVSVGLPSVIGSFATLLLVYCDRWLIDRFLGLEYLGIYSVGLSFGMFIVVLVGAFDTAWPSFFSSYVNRREEAKRLFPLVLTYFVIGFGIITISIFTAAKPMVTFLTAEPFHEAWIVVGLVAFSQVIYGIFSILGTGIYFSRKLGNISLLKWLAAAINIILNLLLIPLLGIVGAAISMFMGYLSLATMTFFMSRHELELNYDWKRISKYCFFLVVIVAIQWASALLLALITSTIVNLFLLLLFMVFVWNWILTSDERHFISSFAFLLRFRN